MISGLIIEQPVEPIDYLTLSVDTVDLNTANRLMDGFAKTGGKVVKLGLEAASAFYGPEGLSIMAKAHRLQWVYDGKLKGINTTMEEAIRKIANYSYPPVAITIDGADMSSEALRATQEAAGDILILGVSLLSDIGPEEAFEDDATYSERKLVEEYGFNVIKVGESIRLRKVMKRAQKFGRAGIKGLVVSPKELADINKDEITKSKFKMVPGARSEGADVNDQKNVMSIEDTIANGADLLVIGRQYTTAENKPRELQKIKDEVARGIERREAPVLF